MKRTISTLTLILVLKGYYANGITLMDTIRVDTISLSMDFTQESISYDDKIIMSEVFKNDTLLFTSLLQSDSIVRYLVNYFPAGGVKSIVSFNEGCIDGPELNFRDDGTLMSFGNWECVDSDLIVLSSKTIINPFTGDTEIIQTSSKGHSVKSGMWFFYGNEGETTRRELWLNGVQVY